MRRAGDKDVSIPSLQDTLSKLQADEARHRQVVEDMGRRMRLQQRQTEHVSKSFGDSGYIFIRTIGQGRFGAVKAAKKKTNQYVTWNPHDAKDFASSMVAVRIIPRHRLLGSKLVADEMFSNKEKYKALMMQIDALRGLDHPNICREYETFEDKQNLYIIMEYYTGGDLLDRESDKMPESRAAWCVDQVVSALAHAHERGIVHQDVRPENLLYASADSSSRLVLCDWECSCFIDAAAEDVRRNIVHGEYSAPELTPDWRSDRGDMWSVGVMAYALLRLEMPFLKGKPEDFTGKVGDSFSPDCQDFIRSLLRMNATERLSAEQALKHPWLLNSRAASAPPPLCSQIAVNIISFRGQNMLKKAASTFAAIHLSGQKLHELTQAFMQMDRNHDGHIDSKELEVALRAHLRHHSASPERDLDDSHTDVLEDVLADSAKLTAVLTALDTDSCGRIGYTEFLAAAAAGLMQDSVHLCWEAFRAFDVDGNGVIQKTELARILHTPELDEIIERMRCTKSRNDGTEDMIKALEMLGGPPESADDIIKRLDANGDSVVTFEEFMEVLFGKQVEGQKLVAPDGRRYSTGEQARRQSREQMPQMVPPRQL